MLAFYEEGSRLDGESFVKALPMSTLCDLTHKLTLAPAGHRYHEWQQPRTLGRLMYVYLDPAKLDVNSELGFAETSLMPRLFFEDMSLQETLLKLKRSIEFATSESVFTSKRSGWS